MRSLVTIQEILDLEPIPGADFIELATVMGWKAIVKKGEYQVGDRCVYFEVDSFLPVEERFEFLRKGSYRNNEFMGPGFRIRTQKLRGCISQGLIMPLDVDEQLEGLEIGTDVTELLGVRKWELPEIEFGHSKDNGDFSLGPKPYGIPTTDELRVQSYGYLRTELIGKPYYITTKMDGTSMTVYHKDGEVGVCSRKLNLIDTGDSPYWSCARRYGLPDSLKELGRNLAIQGEFCGAGIQKNRLRLTIPKYYVFDVVDLDTGTYYGLEEIRQLVEKLNLDMVPVEEEGESFQYTQDELLEKAKGVYPSGLQKEGIVVRPLVPQICERGGHRLSFKTLNNNYLLKED